MKYAYRSGIKRETNKQITSVEMSEGGLLKVIRTMCQESSSGNELYRMIAKRFGKKIKIIISIVYVKDRSYDAISLHRELNGLFLKDGSLAMVTISGLTRGRLEF